MVHGHVDSLLGSLPFARSPVRSRQRMVRFSLRRRGCALHGDGNTYTDSFALKNTEVAEEPARKGSRRARYRKFGFSIRLLLGRV